MSVSVRPDPVEIRHPSQLPAVPGPREVAEELYLAAIWHGAEGGGMSDDGLPSFLVSKAGRWFLVNVEVY